VGLRGGVLAGRRRGRAGPTAAEPEGAAGAEAEGAAPDAAAGEALGLVGRSRVLRADVSKGGRRLLAPGAGFCAAAAVLAADALPDAALGAASENRTRKKTVPTRNTHTPNTGIQLGVCGSSGDSARAGSGSKSSWCPSPCPGVSLMESALNHDAQAQPMKKREPEQQEDKKTGSLEEVAIRKRPRPNPGCLPVFLSSC